MLPWSEPAEVALNHSVISRLCESEVTQDIVIIAARVEHAYRLATADRHGERVTETAAKSTATDESMVSPEW